MNANEKFYDEQIAPELMRLANLCQDRKMSFIACVEYDPDTQGIGRTEVCQPDECGKLSAAQRMTHWAARAMGNLDSFMIACDRHGKEHGHSSMYLRMAGNKNTKSTGNEVAALTIISK